MFHELDTSIVSKYILELDKIVKSTEELAILVKDASIHGYSTKLNKSLGENVFSGGNAEEWYIEICKERDNMYNLVEKLHLYRYNGYNNLVTTKIEKVEEYYRDATFIVNVSTMPLIKI
jgi:hypothetical protein